LDEDFLLAGKKSASGVLSPQETQTGFKEHGNRPSKTQAVSQETLAL